MRWLDSFRKGELVRQNWHDLCLNGNDMSIKNGMMSDSESKSRMRVCLSVLDTNMAYDMDQKE